MSVPKVNRLEEMRAGLRHMQHQYEASKQSRFKYVQWAKAGGMTNQAIADELGLTEAAVRQMLKRAAK